MKDLDNWHKLKKHLDQKANHLKFHDREIWWCSLGINIGREQDGKNADFVRPVLILKIFNNETAWILPLSSKIKSGTPI